MAELESGGLVPDMPPTRPGWMIILGAALVVLTVVALMHEQQLAQILGHLV